MRVIGRSLLMCAVMLGVAASEPRAQAPAPAPDPVVERFALAGDAVRAQILAEHYSQTGDVPLRKALSAFGTEMLRRGDFQTAERYHRATLWLGEYRNDPQVLSIAYANLTSVLGQRGDFLAAQGLARKAIEIGEALSDVETVQSAAANLGIIQRRLGDHDGALQILERALQLAHELKMPDNVARVLNNIGVTYFELGNFALARDYWDRSLAIKLKLDDGGRVTQDTARGYSNIGMLYAELGDHTQALDQYRHALELLQRSGGGPSLSSVLSNMGHAFIALRDLPRAHEHLTHALAIAESQGDKPRIATIQYLLGYLSREEGRYDDAEAIQRKSLAMREALGEPLGVIESLTELSSLAMRRGQPAQALEFATRSASIATEVRLLSRVWKSQSAQGDALLALGRIDDAIAMYQRGIDTIETLRQQTVGGDRARQIYLGQRVAPYYGLARAHALAGRPYEAFVAVERARSRTLLDLLSAGGRTSTRSLTPEQRSRERALTQTVLSLSSELDTLIGRRRVDPAQLESIEQRLTRARLEREAYTRALYQSTPDLRIARGDLPMLSRDELGSLLTPATAVVSFVLDNHQVWAYVITRAAGGGVSAAVRPVEMTAADLVSRAEAFSRQVATRDLAFAGNARQLYDALFVSSKVEPLLAGKSRVVVVPDGPLWRMPFQALQTPRGTFLMEERAISYSPSVAALASLDRRRRSRSAKPPFLLALGDPAIAATGPDELRKAPGRLPQAAREVTALGSLYGADKSKVLVAADATEHALRAHLPKATVVHVATHGVLDDLSPMYSHLLLAPQKDSGSGADGRLDGWEIANLDLDVDLAVLSACETARGSVGDGEGVIGLAWSLLAAGASTAVVSQWEVDSASTTALMIAFHERLLLSDKRAGGRTESPEALRVAAMRLMRSGAYRHPFYWAGFVVVGAY